MRDDFEIEMRREKWWEREWAHGRSKGRYLCDDDEDKISWRKGYVLVVEK